MKMWSPGAKRWVEIEEPDRPVAKKKPRVVQAQWVKVPNHWITALRQTKSGSTKQLALDILRARFERYGKIALTAAMTGMPKTTRKVAARELARLGLIELEENGRQALRVVQIHVGGPSADPW